MIKIIIGILLFICLILIALGYFLFYSVLNQDNFRKACEKNDGNENDDFNFLMAPTLEELNQFLLPYMEKMKTLKFEELEIESFDHLKLHGYLLRGSLKEVVLLYHGYRSSKERD